MGTDIASAAIALASDIFRFFSTIESEKYLNQLTKLELEIQAEQAKGYQRDDGKLETLYQQLPILLSAAQSELALFAKTQTSAVSGAPVIPPLSH